MKVHGKIAYRCRYCGETFCTDFARDYHTSFDGEIIFKDALSELQCKADKIVWHKCYSAAEVSFTNHGICDLVGIQEVKEEKDGEQSGQ